MLIKKTEEKTYDVRLQDKLLAKGLLSRKDIQTKLDQLSDDSANIIEINPSELDSLEEARLTSSK